MQYKRDGHVHTRRDFLKVAGGVALSAGLGGLGKIGKAFAVPSSRKVIVLGIDGMDPHLLMMFIRQGKMPNARELIRRGSFCPLTTSIPPQSPVAWANFITGMGPEGHGIFDFIHRDPATYTPFLSTSKTSAPHKNFSLGDWVIPLSSGEVKLLRGGKAFWNILKEQGVPATVVRIPSNFPPEESQAQTLSGMGTPDVLGTYGTFSYFTSEPDALKNYRDAGGGRMFPVTVKENKMLAYLFGPDNTFRKEKPKSKIPFTLWRDPVNPVVKIELQGKEFILKEGEWSEWLRMKFTMVPYVESVSGICRMYLKEVHPHLKLYISPINIDPTDPALPVSTPPDYAQQLAQAMGYFYTQGMPEDTKALSNLVLTDSEYVDQALFVLREHLRLYDHTFSRFQEGFFFFYFSSLDLNSHMFWRTVDSKHHLFTAELAKKFGWFIPSLYQKMDEVIGKALKMADDHTTLLVMSDHGFTSFRRGFNLNTWLLNNGYATLYDPQSQEETEFFNNVDWRRTRAYGLGINSLYLNIEGREGEGIVSPGTEAEALLTALTQTLTRIKDPLTGEQVITNVYRPGQGASGDYASRAPDLILGYNRNYRASWETTLGKYPRQELVNNEDKWSGDHCMDYVFLPGVLMCNKKVNSAHPALYDLAPSILSEFGIQKSKNMIGKSVFGK